MQVSSKSNQRQLRKTLHKQTSKPTDTMKIMVTWPWTKKLTRILQNSASVKTSFRRSVDCVVELWCQVFCTVWDCKLSFQSYADFVYKFVRCALTKLSLLVFFYFQLSRIMASFSVWQAQVTFFCFKIGRERPTPKQCMSDTMFGQVQLSIHFLCHTSARSNVWRL